MRKIIRLSRDRMRIIARRSSESCVSGFPILVLASFIFLSLQTSCNRAPRLTPIPGTEGVQYNGCNAVSVSPDEEWIVFWVMADDPSNPYEMRMASLQLQTNELTLHTATHLPDGLLSGDRSLWSTLRMRFLFDGWHQGHFYIDLPDQRAGSDIMVVPDTAELKIALAPLNVSCSDCGPRDEFERHGGSLLSDRNCRSSIPYRDGRFSDNAYSTRVDSETVTIVKAARDGNEEVLVQYRTRLFEYWFDALRVSPDERYLAYTLGKRLFPVLPFRTTYTLHILDMKTEEDKRVAGRYRLTTNLMWSRDGSRLYCGGIDLDDRGGIYVVDVKVLFD